MRSRSSIASGLRSVCNRLRWAVQSLLKKIVAEKSSHRFSLGENSAGTQFVLDLTTGYIEQTPTGNALRNEADGMPSVEELAAAIRRAGYRVAYDGSYLRVATEIGTVVVLRDPRKLLRFVRQYRLPAEMEETEAMLLADELNERGLVARFVLKYEQGELWAEFDQPIAAGMSDRQWLAVLRSFVAQITTTLSRTGAVHVIL